jgi:hypothetical protein
MSWVAPKTNWGVDVVSSGDFNRIENNTLHLRNDFFEMCGCKDVTLPIRVNSGQYGNITLSSFSMTLQPQTNLKLIRSYCTCWYDSGNPIIPHLSVIGPGSTVQYDQVINTFGFNDITLMTNSTASAVQYTITVFVYDGTTRYQVQQGGATWGLKFEINS